MFLLDKSGKRMLLNISEIFNQTRAVMLLIPYVNSLQVPTRETAAFVTKPDFTICEKIASFLETRIFYPGGDIRCNTGL
jgi:hypothetical protein